jgi:uncharacterized protein involved in outer membrane biogenesis
MLLPRSKLLKRLLIALGGLLLLAILGLAIALFLMPQYSKSQIERAASDALGMQVTIGGGLKVRLFPSFGVTLQDVRIAAQGAEWVAAQEARMGIDLMPLLHRQIRISWIGLRHVTLTVEQGRDGRFNFQGPASAAGMLPPFDSTDVSLADVTVLYTDRQNGNQWRAGPCDVQASHLQVAAVQATELMNGLGITAAVSCEQIQTRKLLMTDVKFAIDAKQGLYEFRDIRMRAYNGHGSGEVHANYSGRVPSYRLHYVLSRFSVTDFWKTLSQQKIGEGVMDFSTDLTLNGSTVREMTQTSLGTASLHGSNLTLAIGDLDSELSRYESTQKFNLIDIGAFLVAGPLGVAVTKGYDFSRVFGNSGGSSEIPAFISEWQIDRGVAQAKDVAMTTNKNRLALHGSLDFVGDRFQDVTVALVNEHGCARVKQNVRGSFSKPDVEKPNVVVSVTGPVRKLFKKAKHLVGGRCEVFYAGSLPPPK